MLRERAPATKPNRTPDALGVSGHYPTLTLPPPRDPEATNSHLHTESADSLAHTLKNRLLRGGTLGKAASYSNMETYQFARPFGLPSS